MPDQAKAPSAVSTLSEEGFVCPSAEVFSPGAVPLLVRRDHLPSFPVERGKLTNLSVFFFFPHTWSADGV